MRASVRNTTIEIYGLSKEDLDANWRVNSISISEKLFYILQKWINADNLLTYLFYNKKNGHMQHYTAHFSIRRVYFEEKEFFKVINTGAAGSTLPAHLEELRQITPSMNDMYRFIMQKYPFEVFRVEYSNAPADDDFGASIAF